MHTSDCKGAGTDANVFCRLHGRTTDGEAASTAVLQLASSANNFERCRKDVFVVAARELAHVEALEIGHDGAGLFADWHLQHVEVVNSAGEGGGARQVDRALACPAECACASQAFCRHGMRRCARCQPLSRAGHVCAGQRTCFVHNDWISSVKGRQLNMVTLQPGVAPGADNTYAVKVHTGDARGAGSDADVSIVLIGADGARTGELRLESSRNDFERGRCDEFLVNVKVRVSTTALAIALGSDQCCGPCVINEHAVHFVGSHDSSGDLRTLDTCYRTHGWARCQPSTSASRASARRPEGWARCWAPPGSCHTSK